MNRTALISAIQTHVKDLDGKQVKAFYENDLGFTDVFTEEDNYMDYFTSDDYLKGHIQGKEDEIEAKLKALNIEISYNQEDDEIKVIINKLRNINIDPLPIKPDFADRIKIMIEEAIVMAEHKSYLGVIIFVGSILEAIILGMLKNDPSLTGQLQSDFHDPSNRLTGWNNSISRHFEDRQFYQLLAMANKFGMYNDIKINKQKADIIRYARNYVHPNEQISKSNFTSNDAYTSVGGLDDIIDSFKKYQNYI